MRIRQLLTDDDAVSPVIGVILMVAITVILAAVIGAFVLGFGGGGPSAPTASWDTAEESSGNISFTVASASDTIEASTLECGGDSSDSGSQPDGASGELSAGDTVYCDYSAAASGGSTGTISLVWSEEGSSSTLSEHEVDDLS